MAFLEYKSTDEGKEIEDKIVLSRNDLKEKRALIKVLTDACNKSKKDIDTVKGQLDLKA